MALSLTRDEFLERLAEGSRLFQVAIAHDLTGNTTFPGIEFKPGANPELSKALAPVLSRLFLRAVDLVYQEE